MATEGKVKGKKRSRTREREKWELGVGQVEIVKTSYSH